MPRKKQPVRIKRELWRGKYYAVAREHGRFKAIERYSRKRPIKKLKEIYRQNRTFSKNILKKHITSRITAEKRGYYIDEIDDFKSKRPLKKYKRFSVVIEAYAEGKYISATSSQYDIRPENIETAKDEAYDNFYGKLYQIVVEDVGSGEVKDGELLYNSLKRVKGGINIKEGFRYYAEVSA